MSFLSYLHLAPGLLHRLFIDLFAFTPSTQNLSSTARRGLVWWFSVLSCLLQCQIPYWSTGLSPDCSTSLCSNVYLSRQQHMIQVVVPLPSMWSSWLPALAWPSRNWCSHLGKEPSGGSSLSLSLPPPSLSFSLFLPVTVSLKWIKQILKKVNSSKSDHFKHCGVCQ